MRIDSLLHRCSPRLVAIVVAVWLACVSLAVPAADTVRPEVGTPLQAAQEMVKAKNFKGALAKVKEAEKVPNLTSYESYIIASMRAAAAIGARDYTTATHAYYAVLASPHLPEGEKLPTMENLAKIAYAARQYPKAIETIQRYQASGGKNSDVLGLLPQALYIQKRYAEAATEITAQIKAGEAAGKAPTETQLQLLANCALKQGDNAGYLSALERLVTYYPKKDYWLDVALRTARRPGFSDRLSLDLYRLRLATGTLDETADYVEATQLAIQAGLPGEAQDYLKHGYAAKLLGTGPSVERHNRLKALVAKAVAEDKATLAQGEREAAAMPAGDGLVNTGLNYVGYGQYERGIALMEKGITKGSLKREDEARLHLGYAYLKAGRKDAAAKILKTVSGEDGTRDLARLWIMHSRNR